MSGFAVARGRYEPEVAWRASGWERYYLRAAASLILLFPLMAVIDAMIQVHDCGPALFTQARVGKDGRVFRICKFRTIDDTLLRTTSQIQHDCLPETDNCVCRQTRRGVIKVRSARVSV